uniref:Putative metalloprotease n=1 Tax=Ixodes ricinus TaxID=34613 RepID=A0A0K8RHJ0_IXORI
MLWYGVLSVVSTLIQEATSRGTVASNLKQTIIVRASEYSFEHRKKNYFGTNGLGQNRVGPKLGPANGYIAYPRLLEERGEHGEKLLRIKDGLTLRLEKITSLGENFVFTERNGTQLFYRYVNPKELEEGLFEDRRQLAAVSVKQTNEGVEIGGMLSPTLRIAPLKFMARSQDGSIAHEVSEIQAHANYNHDFILQPDALLKARALRNYYWNRPSPQPVTIPEVFVVEVKLVVDRHHHEHFDRFENLIKYLLLIIAMMSHRYQDITSPKVRFLLVEVERNNGTHFSDTVHGSDPINPKGKQKLFLNAETTMAKLVQTQSTSTADVVVLITGMDLTGVSSGKLNPGLLGRAYVGAVCARTYKVAVVEDVANTYSGVSVLSHELGHALGMPHDGESPQWPDPANTWTRCTASDEYLMAPTDGGRNSGHFSVCSIAALRIFVRTLRADCFLVRSQNRYSQAPKELPGITMNATTFCKRTYSTFKTVTSRLNPVLNARCQIECCIYDLGYCYRKNMIDGMPCGVSKTCLRHKCGYHGHQTTTTTPRTRPTPTAFTRLNPMSTTKKSYSGAACAESTASVPTFVASTSPIPS